MHDFHVNKTYSLIDKSFQPDFDDKHFLSVEFSPGRFTYCILDSSRFKYRVMESYEFEYLLRWEIFFNDINNIVESNSFLQMDFQRVSLIYVSPLTVFVPSDLFEENEIRRYLEFNQFIDTDIYTVNSEKLYNLDAYAIYPFPKALNSDINNLFSQNRIRHFSSTLIESVLYDIRYHGYNADLVLHVQKEHFEILVLDKKGKLVFFNSFIYQAWDDILYYLFYVTENLGLSAEGSELMLIGEASMDSELYNNLRLYFRVVDFGSRSDMYKYDEVFDNIPHHYFYNLLNSHACG